MFRLTRLVPLGLAFALLALASGPASAHEGEGEDVAFAHLKATQAGGMTSVEVHILDPAPCVGFDTLRLVAERQGATATGVIQQTGKCSFAGAIELPEPGRWSLIVRLDYDGRTAEAAMPVGVSETAASFEVETWFHSDAAASDGVLPAWLNVQALGLYAVVGIAMLALVVFLLRSREGERAQRV